MQKYWLLKSDPETYAYDHLERDGKTVWDGVRNNLALKHLRNVSKGDLALIYHTGNEKAIVGIAEILSNAYPDPKQSNPRMVVVDIAAKQRFSHPIKLDDIKKQKAFSDFDLVRLPRLSVMPVSDAQWHHLVALGK